MIRGAVLILLLTLAWLHCSAKINLITADLGRHIRNGEIFLKAQQVLSTNFYSYTNPDFPTVCHHWGTGVIFYLIWLAGGFLALSASYTGILVATGALCFEAARRAAGFWPAVLMSVLALPLIGSRTEIRPEGLTTLFLAVEYLILMGCRARTLSPRWLWAIALVQLVWINVHILFITGFALLTFFIVDAWINDLERGRWKMLAFVGGVSLALSLVNPFGLEGFLEPFDIFRVYGYRLAENQDVFFMMKRFAGIATYGYFLVLLGVSAVLLILRVCRERDWKAILLDALILLFFGLMAVKAVRAISMFGYLFIPVVALQLAHVIRLYGGAGARHWHRLIAVAAAGMVAMAAVNPYFFYSPLQRSRLFLYALDEKYRRSLFVALLHPDVWGGLAPDVNGSAGFFQAQGLRGPVFNNYDIGGYLIFHLFPQERPFVDNRPEAYPNEFFAKVYAPMQEDEKAWAEVDRSYGFQAIFFYRHDQTTWGQPFLIRRLQDPAWAPVFVDAYTIILAKRGGVNQKVISKFELPREMFQVTKN